MAAYQSFNDKARAPILRIGDAEKAIRLFAEAQKLTLPHNAGTLLAIKRNIGVVHIRLAAMTWFQERNKKTPRAVEHHFAEGLKDLEAAIDLGVKVGKDESWLGKTAEKIREAVSAITAYGIDAYDSSADRKFFAKRCSLLERVARNVSGPISGHMLHMAVLDEQKKEHTRRSEGANNWAGCLWVTDEMEGPLEGARSSLTKLPPWAAAVADRNLLEGHSEFREANASKSRSQQHIFIGKEILCSAVEGDDELNLDMVFGALDEFKYAEGEASRAKASDIDLSVECEAMAIAEQAALYQHVLKLNDRAQPLLMNVMQLCGSITASTGKIFQHEKWYMKAVADLESIRQIKLTRDEEELKKVRAPTLLELKPELDAIEAAINVPNQTSDGFRAHNLLKHIYTAHPPKKSSHVLKQELKDSATVPGPGKEAVRKGLVRASLSYHPDHNKEYGVKWLVLCEEIQKKINEYVTALKDLS